MKRATSMLGALAMAVAGFLFAAPAAQAQTALQTVSNGGVTCKQYSTGYSSYPLTYWDCINTASPPTSFESVVGQAARDKLTSGMKSTLSNVEIMIFQDRNNFASFTGAAAPSSKYVAWTAPSGPGALSSKKIAAVFAQADLWSSNISPTNQIATRDITAYYKSHIMQALGRQYDQLTGNPSQLQQTPVHIFPIAVEYDAVWTNDKGASTVWGSTLSGQYAGQTAWQILGNIYGNTSADIYAYQFGKASGASGWSHHDQFVNAYLKETAGFRQQQIFNDVVALPVTGRWNPTTHKAVFCVTYSTIYNQPADTIRDCVHPYGATAGEKQAGQAIGNLPAAFRTSLNSLSLPVHAFVMRDITDYETYYNLTPGVSGGDAGISFAGGHTGPDGITAIPVVAFRDTLASFPGIVENYYPGSLVHEAGHMLDDLVWLTAGVSYSQSTDWNNKVNADKNLFNALSCMSALNDSAACSTTDPNYAGKTNWDRFLTKMGMYGKTQGFINREVFCFMFQRKSSAGTFTFMQYVENKLWTLSTPSMKNKMDSIWTVGHP